jgi:hypothetical protein
MGGLGLVAGLGCIVATVLAGSGRLPRVLEGAPLVVGEDISDAVLLANGKQPELRLRIDNVGTEKAAIAIDRPWFAEVQLTHTSGTLEQRRLTVLPASLGLTAALGLVMLLIALPYLILPPRTQTSDGDLDPWMYLLSEPAGGLSLSRVQLLVWFVPAAAMYAALSIPERNFAPLTPTVVMLLGLGGITTVLGAATTPTKPAVPTAPAVPQLGDLVQDWNGRGDLSRYQYLVLSILGALILVATFIERLAFPDLPAQFLYLVAASQSTYLATKAVKSGS